MAGLIAWASIVDGAATSFGSTSSTRDGARRLAHRQGVDEDEDVVAVEQLVGEVDAADAVVAQAHAVGAAASHARRSATSTPKPSSPKKMLPMPATRTSHRSSTSSGREVVEAALRRQQLGGGIVVEGDGEVVVAVDVVEHARHRGRPGRRGTGRGRRRAGVGRSTHLRAPADGPTPADRRPCRPNGSTAPSTARIPPRCGAGLRRVRRRCRGRQRADGAVQPLPDLGRHVVAAVDDGRRPGVGAARLGLLVVGEREDPQGEDLVDLGGVEQVARALRRRPPGGRTG